MKIPALILARGGSKGIPRKNLQAVSGVSIVGRCVVQAVQSRMDPVFVWSDSRDIRQEARKWGAETPGRPEEVSGDSISTEETVKSFLRQEDGEAAFAAIAVLQCTTPFLKAEHLDKAVDAFVHGRLDSVVSATRFTRFLGYPGSNGKTKFIPLRPYRALRQEPTPEMYMENGGIYLAARHIWMQGKRIGAACGVVEMGWWESLEIDDPLDLDIARSIAHIFYAKEKMAKKPVTAALSVETGVKWIHHGKE